MIDSISDPWADDLFGRKDDANDLISYIRSAYRYGSFVGEERSQVIAVDASYGIGKTFFLKRLARQISCESPVAYLDTWSDDFVGEPLISLAATLEEAFKSESYTKEIEDRWTNFASKAGKIALIGGKGLSKQALKFLITQGAVEGIEAVWDGSDEELRSEVRTATDDALEDASDDLAKTSPSTSSREYLRERIFEHKRARGLVNELRAALSELAKQAERQGLSLPVFIIIEELDRCRPNYAIKVLEEIKHLFNVPEVYFIIGINSDQLSSSFSHEYGSQFDGRQYLDRFIDRTFRLPFPSMESLVQSIYPSIAQSHDNELWFPQTHIGDNRNSLTSIQWLAYLLEFHRISPRGIFKFFDRLRTALALIENRVVPMNYLCQLIAEEIADVKPSGAPKWRMLIPGHFGNSGEWAEGNKLFQTMRNVYGVPRSEMRKVLNDETPIGELVWEFVVQPPQLGPESYEKLVHRLSKFGDVDE
ncbi:hypothetical protein GCM10023208_12640 [Erythrobacter westpacificensis]|uniref:KAP NTPase domain-containing protein n=1 Tax=Erythrobacter westpacificensis TaxID=1055231 RepID=A0ABP9K6Q6_9SPHN